VDLLLLPEKERNKIINQRARDAKKAMEKAKMEAQKAKDKTKKESKKTKENSEVQSSGCLNSSTFVDTDFDWIVGIECLQAGCLFCTTPNITTAIEHIIAP
jgi:uncharacterized protein YuzE